MRPEQKCPFILMRERIEMEVFLNIVVILILLLQIGVFTFFAVNVIRLQQAWEKSYLDNFEKNNVPDIKPRKVI
jgi:hypothetical protein